MLLASSAIEGWGMVLVEAQAMGCVPIAFDTYSALHDIIEDEATGCLVANDDLQEYALRLARLMRDEPLRRAMAERTSVRPSASASTSSANNG